MVNIILGMESSMSLDLKMNQINVKNANNPPMLHPMTKPNKDMVCSLSGSKTENI